jgi:hypothetical protein
MKKFIKTNQTELIFLTWYFGTLSAIIYYWSQIF